MGDKLVRKGLIVGIIILFIGSNFVSGTNVQLKNMTNPLITGRGNTLYVGGTGEGNYTRVQDAINDSVDGDTVFVYDDSSPYYEIIFIGEDKSIKLLGENRDTTILDANEQRNHVVEIRADGVEFSGFTVQNSVHVAGIMVTSSKNYIHDCKIYNNIRGIQLQAGIDNEKPYPRDNIISNNLFVNNTNIGLIVYSNINCSIIANIAVDNILQGICVFDGRFNVVKGNIIKNNPHGLEIFSSFNKITDNLIQNSSWRGIDITRGNINIIMRNNFIDNGPNNYEHANFYECWWQYWSDNYWSPRRFQPSNSTKPVMINSVGPFFVFPPRVNFDWHPAKEPYDIGV